MQSTRYKHTSNALNNSSVPVDMGDRHRENDGDECYTNRFYLQSNSYIYIYKYSYFALKSQLKDIFNIITHQLWQKHNQFLSLTLHLYSHCALRLLASLAFRNFSFSPWNPRHESRKIPRNQWSNDFIPEIVMISSKFHWINTIKTRGDTHLLHSNCCK